MLGQSSIESFEYPENITGVVVNKANDGTINLGSTHLWTGDLNEYNVNTARGWEGQGDKWNAVSIPD